MAAGLIMQKLSIQTTWLITIGVLATLFYLLSPILTPFILAALLAYLTDPLVKKLEKRRLSHLVSVTIVFCLIFFTIFLLPLLLIPLLQKQITQVASQVPALWNWISNQLMPYLHEVLDNESIKSAVSNSIDKAGGVVHTVIRSGYTVMEWVVNIVLTPIVTFYLLRDWDKLNHNAKLAVPKAIRPEFVRLAKECDAILSAFFRGQLLLMLAIAVIYAIGLSIIGLQLGFIIGIVGGLLTIVPYLGSGFVLIAASLASYIQYGSFHHLLWVLLVFLIGQGLEGYVLSPYLVGQRIGLHPVVVIFAVMAGGTLFGFFGVLVALPAAAVIKVLLKALRDHYFAN